MSPLSNGSAIYGKLPLLILVCQVLVVTIVTIVNTRLSSTCLSSYHSLLSFFYARNLSGKHDPRRGDIVDANRSDGDVYKRLPGCP